MSNCVACGGALDPVLLPAVVHPTCLMVDEPGGDPFSVMLKQKLTDIIIWFDQENPRSKQQAIGPSEIGDPCDRRIGYRLANIPEINTRFDPWAGIVGTALHSWLEKAVSVWSKENGSVDWHTETTLILNEFAWERLEPMTPDWEEEHAGLHGYAVMRPELDARFEERFFEWRPYPANGEDVRLGGGVATIRAVASPRFQRSAGSRLGERPHFTIADQFGCGIGLLGG